MFKNFVKLVVVFCCVFWSMGAEGTKEGHLNEKANAVLSEFSDSVRRGGDIKEAMRRVQPALNIDFELTEESLEVSCYAVWGVCIRFMPIRDFCLKHNDLEFKTDVDNFLTFAGRVFSNKKVAQEFVNSNVILNFPKSFSQLTEEKDFNFEEIADTLEYFFPCD